jgi:peroxiredoxin (alkyl hydroperoxide reductase subunit C)
MSRSILAFVLVLALCVIAWSEGGGGAVLGACGSPSENEAAPAASGLAVSSVPLPGQRAINFELPAVIGNEIKKVKLSDFNGKWRVLCFYPADFTFV